MAMNKRRLRVLIVVGVIVVLALGAYLLVSTVDVVALLRQMHGG